METKSTKTVSAHLVKNDVICLDKSPVKPVVVETNGTDQLCSQKDKMKNDEELGNGCHGNSTEESMPQQDIVTDVKQEPEVEESDKSKDTTSGVEEGGSCQKSCKKPTSFDLLPGKICKTRPPSRRGKLARQRTVSETSYKKEHHRMVHAISDPTGFESNTILGEEECVKKENVAGEPEKGKDLEEKKNKQGGITKSNEDKDGETHTSDKEVDNLANKLDSSLNITPVPASQNEIVPKEEGDQQILDLAEDLEKGLSVKDDRKDESKGSKVITIKEVASEGIVIKKEPQDAASSSREIIVKKEPSDLENSSTCKKLEESTSMSRRLSGERKEMLSRGIGVDGHGGQPQYTNQMPMTSCYQQRPQQTTLRIPGFQQAFIQTPDQRQMQIQQDRFIRAQIQSVQPPCYPGINQQEQRPIILPTGSPQTVIYQPSTTSGNQRATFRPGNGYYPSQPQQFYPQQNQCVMPLQQPQQQSMVVLPNRREPVESGWPPTGPYDDSDTNSVASPPHIEDDPLPSPHGSVSSIASDTTSMGLNPVSPISGQTSPSAIPFHGSPYHRVPSLSPDLTQVNSPQAPSPGSPSSQTIRTTGSNFGVVTIIDKPSSPKRQCLGDKQQEVNNIIDYLKHGSPQTADEQEQDPASPLTSNGRVNSQVPTVTQANLHHTRLPSSSSSVGGYQQAHSPAGSSHSSCDTPPPPGPIHNYHPHQPSPPHGMSPVVSSPYTFIPPQEPVVLQHGYYPGTTQLGLQYSGQTQTEGFAMTPSHSASQPDFELQDWQQKVARLTDEQLREQDEDKDTVLHLAVIQEQKMLVSALVERLKGTEAMNMKNKHSQTSVYLAAVINQPEFVFFLIRNGADPTIPAEHPGDTPLHVAARQGYVEVIEAIFQALGRSPDDFIDRKNFDGKSPLHCAVESHGEVDRLNESEIPETIDSMQTIEVLMKYGASAMCQDGKSGKTPLHYSIEMHKKDITRLLLDRCENAGDLVNSQTYNGNTALHLVVGQQKIPKEEILEMVALLMSRGANVSIENAEKEPPARLVQKGHDVIKKHLAGQAHDGTRR